MIYNYGSSRANLSSTIGAALGTFGNVLILWTCFRSQQLKRTISARLIIHQTLSLLIESVVILVLPSGYYSTCIIQGPLVEYSIIANTLWSCVTCYVLLQMTQRKLGKMLMYNPEDDMLKFKLICYLAPLPLAVAPWITGDYGLLDGGWCWIRTFQASGRRQRDTHYILVWVFVLYIVTSSIIVYCKLLETSPKKPKLGRQYRETTSSVHGAEPSTVTVDNPVLQQYQRTQAQSQEQTATATGRCSAEGVSRSGSDDSSNLSSPVPSMSTLSADTPPSTPSASVVTVNSQIRSRQTQRISATRAMFGRVILYPLLLIIIWAPLSVYRLWQSFGSDSNPPALLLVIGAGTIRAHGLLNCIVFGTQSSVQRVWWREYTLLRAYISMILSCTWVKMGGANERSSELTELRGSQGGQPHSKISSANGSHRHKCTENQPRRNVTGGDESTSISRSASSVSSSATSDHGRGPSSSNLICSPASTANSSCGTAEDQVEGGYDSTMRYASSDHDIESVGYASTHIVNFVTESVAHSLDDQAVMKRSDGR